MSKIRKKKIEIIDAEPATLINAEEPDETDELPPSSVKIEVDAIDPDDDNVELIGKNQQFSLAMYIDKNMDPKNFMKFIKKVEKTVRGNPDYKQYLEYLRDEEGMDKCAYFHNVNSSRAEIQIHHVLSNLYTICVTVCNRLMSTGKKVSTFILADEVIQLHMKNWVALVPLTTTIHELVHANKIKIPKGQIFGDYASYYEMHEPFMDEFERAIYKDNETYLVIDKADTKQLEYKKDEDEDSQ